VSRVYWDTLWFVSIQQAHPQFGPLVRQAYGAILQRNDTRCTSVFTIGAMLTLPKREKNDAVIQATRKYMLDGEVEVLPFTLNTAEIYSEVRSYTRLRPADAIHLASATEAGARLLVTDDDQLKKVGMAGIPTIVGLDGKIW
jgi:predicted nucleic acid-binding protein